MRNFIYSSLFVFLILNTSFKPVQILNYTNGKKHFEFTSANGILSGHFISYYENGNKMIEGNFSNNQKTGDWNVWNENGTLVAERVYKNNYSYADGDLLLNHQNPKEYNFLVPGEITQPLAAINPADILIKKTLWRTIDNSGVNLILFHDQLVSQAMVEALNNSAIAAYTNDDLNVQMTSGQAGALAETVISSFRIREDFIFDAQRKIGEYRIIAIAPVGEIGGKLQPVCWFDYSQLRGILSTIQVKNSALPSFVQNAEQIFFYRYFGSEIYKESNIYNRQLSDYCKPDEMADESIKIELSLIEQECRLWNYEKRK